MCKAITLPSLSSVIPSSTGHVTSKQGTIAREDCIYAMPLMTIVCMISFCGVLLEKGVDFGMRLLPVFTGQIQTVGVPIWWL